MDLNLADRVALVTGAGQGIGRAIALALARQGAVVGVNDINPDTARRTTREIHDLGAVAAPFVVDVTDFSGVQAMVEAVKQRWGRLDSLVNNAGISRQAPIHEMPLERWHEVINVNLHSVFYCTRAAFPLMMAQQYGRIVSISSLAAKRGTMFGQNIAYCASKAAIMGLTVALAAEGAPYNITVNAVAPGSIQTDMLATEHSPERQRFFLERIPLKRFATADEVAAAVVFLASDAAAYITGEIMDVNGGLYLDL
jgi:NAD(P)-dependent dehydrogenase (short-subunit alcohol dehydrogenase family)